MNGQRVAMLVQMGLCAEQEPSCSPEALLHEKELQLEVERLRTRCRDGDIRTASLLQEMHQMQKDAMEHRDAARAAEIKLREIESASKVCLSLLINITHELGKYLMKDEVHTSHIGFLKVAGEF